MRDVHYAQNRQKIWVFKALTPRAEEEMKKQLEVPGLPGEVFMHCADKDLPFMLRALRGAGLQTEADPPKQVDVSALTDF